MTSEDALKHAEDYLDREREILLAGRLFELEALVKDRERVMAILAGVTADRVRIGRLRERALRNGALLSAAADGVNRAIKRLADLRKAAGPIGSYSSSGGRCEIGSINPEFERKA